MKPLLFTNIDNKAEDISVLHITGNEDVAGTKNFSTAPQIGGSDTAKDSDVVHKSGDTVTGTLWTTNYRALYADNSLHKMYISCSHPDTFDHGAFIALSDENDSENGAFRLAACNVDNETQIKQQLIGNTNGTLTWRGYNVITAEGGTDHGIVNGMLTAKQNITLGVNSYIFGDGTNTHISINSETQSNFNKGANLQLRTERYTSSQGTFSLTAATSTQSCSLNGYPDKTLRWNNGNIFYFDYDLESSSNKDLYYQKVNTVVKCESANWINIPNGLNTSNPGIISVLLGQINDTTTPSWCRGVYLCSSWNGKHNLWYGVRGMTSTTLFWKKILLENDAPAGKIMWVAFSSSPSGYLLCNGGEVSRTTYSNLFTAIGTTYGEGDGSTTFNVPNLIGRVAWGSTTAGTYYDAGLPNITGTIQSRTVSTQGYTGAIKGSSGAFNTTEKGSGYSSQTCELSTVSSTNDQTTLDASRSSSIYGNSSTVQPPALTLVPYIKY